MAIDHGAARTGVAVSDPTGTVARPLPVVLKVDSPQGMDHLVSVIAGERPERILVGHPRLMSGAPGAQARAASGFAGRLRRRVEVPVELVDERLSTAEAARRSRETGAAGRRNTPALDSLAACVLLETYLRSTASARPA
jgi:putative Holliday junction resolvase